MEKAIQLIKALTRANSVRLLPCGDSAIFSFLAVAKKIGKRKVIIPDQGGWFGFKRYATILDFDIINLKTEDALIIPEILENHADEDSCMIYQNPGGYFVAQPIEDIWNVCKKHECLLCLDITGSIGSRNDFSDYADFIFSSFGRWKIINLGYGGFIGSSRYKLNEFRDVFRMFKTNFCCMENKLYSLISRANERYKKLHELAERTAKELAAKGFEVIHRDRLGINVCVRFKDDNELKALKEFCASNGFEYVECPFNPRIDAKALSIELKRKEIL